LFAIIHREEGARKPGPCPSPATWELPWLRRKNGPRCATSDPESPMLSFDTKDFKGQGFLRVWNPLLP